jgi:hypothetical protein
MERVKLMKLNAAEVKEQNQVEISNRFSALENLHSEMNINTVFETIREKTKLYPEQI